MKIREAVLAVVAAALLASLYLYALILIGDLMGAPR